MNKLQRISVFYFNENSIIINFLINEETRQTFLQYVYSRETQFVI